MTEATQQGADVHSAATRIESLLGAQPEPPKEEEKQQPEANQEFPDEEQKPVEEEKPQEEPKEDEPSNDAYEIPQTAEQLAADLGIEQDKLLGLKLKAKIDGVESEATLAELLKSYQLEGHLNKKSMELAEQRKAAEAEIAQHKAQLAQQAEQGTALINALSNELFKEYNAINWDELHEVDPGQWAAKRAQFQDRYYQIQQAQTQFSQQLSQQMQAQQQAQAEQFANWFEGQKQAVFEKLPEWKNQEVAKKEGKEISDYLKATGFSEDETKSIYDHRQVVIARKAMLYDKLMAAKPAIENKVKTVPKVLKAGSPKSKIELNAERNAQRMNALKRTGKIDDAASVLMGLL